MYMYICICIYVYVYMYMYICICLSAAKCVLYMVYARRDTLICTHIYKYVSAVRASRGILVHPGYMYVARA